MSTHNICIYKEVDKKYTGCNLKTTELLDCALIEICVVITLNMVCDDTQGTYFTLGKEQVLSVPYENGRFCQNQTHVS